MNRLEWKIAGRYLRSRRSSRLVSLITLIATSGVTVGVMALVVVMGVMNGLQTELRDRILIASPHLRVFTYGEGLRMESWRTALDSVRSHPDVVAAAPMVFAQGMVSKGSDYTEGVMVLGIEQDTGKISVTELPQQFLSGDLRFKTELDDVEGGIVLGERIARRLTAFPGDRLTTISPAGSKYNRAVGAFIPKIRTYEMIGTFETGMFDYDNNYVVLPLEQAQAFAGLDSAVSGLDVRITDPWKAPEVGRDLEKLLGYPYRYLDWQTQNASLFSALKLEKLAMSLILLLIVIVAAFNIVSTLTMVVTDKTREIGILRAMGMPAGSIRKVFVLQGAIIGTIGTALGAGIGLVVASVVDSQRLITIPAEVYFIDHLPVQVDWLDFVIVVAASLAVAIVATVYPARRAAGFIPVEAIRDA